MSGQTVSVTPNIEWDEDRRNPHVAALRAYMTNLLGVAGER
jgi:hypothetical protein